MENAESYYDARASVVFYAISHVVNSMVKHTAFIQFDHVGALENHIQKGALFIFILSSARLGHMC